MTRMNLAGGAHEESQCS